MLFQGFRVKRDKLTNHIFRFLRLRNSESSHILFLFFSPINIIKASGCEVTEFGLKRFGHILEQNVSPYLHQALTDPHYDDAAEVHPRRRGDQHVQAGSGDDGEAKHPAEAHRGQRSGETPGNVNIRRVS